MRGARILLVEAALALLLNVTAGLIGRDAAITLTKWGWFLFSIHATYLAASSEKSIRLFVRFKAAARRLIIVSYLVVAGIGALVGILYWKGIEAAYNRLFPSEFRVVFSPEKLVPESVRVSVTEEFRKDNAYLKQIGFEPPLPVPPVQVSESMPRAIDGKSLVSMIQSPQSGYGDSIIVSPYSASQITHMRGAYFSWAFNRLLNVPAYQITEHQNRWLAAQVFASYYAGSYSKKFSGYWEWDKALWDMRTQFDPALRIRIPCSVINPSSPWLWES